MNTDRLIVGVATCFGVRAHGGTRWTAEMFAGWLRTETGLPVRVDHASLIDHRGVLLHVGAARRFCPVRTPVDGLLALCEIGEGEWCDAILEDVARHLDGPEWLPSYGFSLGARVLPGETALPFELSLTLSPGFADARVLSVGPDALRTWQFLIEENQMIRGAA